MGSELWGFWTKKPGMCYYYLVQYTSDPELVCVCVCVCAGVACMRVCVFSFRDDLSLSHLTSARQLLFNFSQLNQLDICEDSIRKNIMLFIRQNEHAGNNVLSDIRSLSSSLLSFVLSIHPVSLHLSCCGFAEMHGLSCVRRFLQRRSRTILWLTRLVCD